VKPRDPHLKGRPNLLQRGQGPTVQLYLTRFKIHFVLVIKENSAVRGVQSAHGSMVPDAHIHLWRGICIHFLGRDRRPWFANLHELHNAWTNETSRFLVQSTQNDADRELSEWRISNIKSTGWKDYLLVRCKNFSFKSSRYYSLFTPYYLKKSKTLSIIKFIGQ
jgi:hypothetical protein